MSDEYLLNVCPRCRYGSFLLWQSVWGPSYITNRHDFSYIDTLFPVWSLSAIRVLFFKFSLAVDKIVYCCKVTPELNVFCAPEMKVRTSIEKQQQWNLTFSWKWYTHTERNRLNRTIDITYWFCNHFHRIYRVVTWLSSNICDVIRMCLCIYWFNSIDWFESMTHNS